MTVLMAAAAMLSTAVTFFVAAAGMTLFVIATAVAFPMVVVTVRTGGYQFSFQIGLHRLVHISLCTGTQLNARLRKRRLRSAADAAADQYIHRLSGQQTGKRAVSDAVGGNHFTGDHFFILHLIYLKVFRSSKMLEDVSVIISYRYFHPAVSPFSDILPPVSA